MLTWRHDATDIHAERIATIMSSSLWASMTGAPFLDPPSGNEQSAQATAAPPPSDSRPNASDEEEKKPGAISTGTGFFVTGSGDFVTNDHVVVGCSKAVVKTIGAPPQGAAVAAEDKTNDLALLKTSKTPNAFANLRTDAQLGEPVAAFGFPHTDILSTNGNFTLGNVTATTGIRDDSRYLQISAPVNAGNSGGPLLDQSGNVIGVVSAKLNALVVAAQDGDLPQNVNFAIKAEMVAAFLRSNGVTPAKADADTPTLKPTELAKRAEAISGFVACE
jgi:S1-C subfamily serine protease